MQSFNRRKWNRSVYKEGLWQSETDKDVNFNIRVSTGTFDFSAENLTDRKWYFADGSTSTDERPTRELTSAQVVRLTGDFVGSTTCELVDNDTDSNFVGDLSDLPNINFELNLLNCLNTTGDLSDLPQVTNGLTLSNCVNITGDLSDLPPLNKTLSLYGCPKITGDLSDLPDIDYWLSLHDCVNITGDLSDLPIITEFLSLKGCDEITGYLSDLPDIDYFLKVSGCTKLTGSLNNTQTAIYIDLTNINCTSSELDTTIANLVTANKSDGDLILTGLTRSAASSAGVATLEGRGWTITDATIE